MAKSFAVFFAVAVLIAGCVSLTSGTPAPSTFQVSPTLGITTIAPTLTAAATAAATPTLAPTATLGPTPTLAVTLPPTPHKGATPSPTEVPSELPSTQPTELPSINPSGSPSIGYDPKDQLFDDTLATNDGWVTGSTGGGPVSFQPGELQLAPSSSGAWIVTSRPTGATNDTLLVVGEVTASADGQMGMFCRSGDTYFGAVLTTEGAWYLVDIENSTINVLDHSDAGVVNVQIGVPTDLAVECAGLKSGKVRLEMWTPADGLIAIHQQDQGPETWDGAAVYGFSSTTGPFTVSLTHAQAFGVGTGTGEPSSGAQDLILSHIPHDWASKCFESPVPPFDGGLAKFLVTCFLGETGNTGAEVAEYASYNSVDDMNGTYQERVQAFPAFSGETSCQNGAVEEAYHYTGHTEDAGRLLCTDQTVGIRFDWTENKLNILSTLVDLDGSYSDTYNDWLKAGPN